MCCRKCLVFKQFQEQCVSAYAPAAETPRWLEAFYQRSTELAVLAVALLLLTVALIAQRRTAATRRRLQVFRVAFLAFTLGFIGWYAQGQLTIVSITAAIEALMAGSSLEFLLADPMVNTNYYYKMY